MMKKVPRRALFTAGLLVLGGLVALLPLMAQSRQPREIRIVARQMTFYVEGSGPGNPVIRLKPGERVRLTFVNEDAGVDHDLAVPAWSLTTELLRGEGRTSMVFDAPQQAGKADYVCSRHVAMMTGTIELVTDAGNPTTSAR
jgi:plastocyanin